MAKSASSPLLVCVFDFDGTLSINDVGNDIAKMLMPDAFDTLYGAYRNRSLPLRPYQEQLWALCPASVEELSQHALACAKIAPGAVGLLCDLIDAKAHVHVASAGLDVYIRSVLEHYLPHDTFSQIKGIWSNHYLGSGQFRVCEFHTPTESIHKGAICQMLRQDPKCLDRKISVIGIGNGSSDKLFAGHIDVLFAKDKLKTWCAQNQIPHLGFDDLTELRQLEPIASLLANSSFQS